MQVRHTSVRWIAAFLCAVSAVCVLGLRTTAALGQSGETGLLTVDPKHNWTPQEVKDLPYEGVYSLREARQDWNNADKQQELGQDLRFYGTGTFIGPDLYRPKDQMVVLPIGPTFWMRELVAISEDFARYAELDYFTRPRGDWDMSIRVHWGLWEPMVSEHLAGVADAYPMAAYFGGYAARRTDIPREEKSEKDAACRYYRLMQYGNPNVRALLWEYPVSYDFVEVGSLEQALKIY